MQYTSKYYKILQKKSPCDTVPTPESKESNKDALLFSYVFLWHCS